MLDLKAKLLAAGVVTADQVKKVEDEQAERRAREKERRETERRRREEGPPPGREEGPPPGRETRGARGDRGPGPRGDRGHGGPRGGPGGGPHGDRRDRPRGERPPREARPDQAAVVDGAPAEGTPAEGAPRRLGKPRDTRSFKERRADENLEKRARREQEWTEALRWRDRLDALKAAGKSEQYAAVRGWVMKERLDNTQITEAAQRFFFTTYAGTLSHLTVEPDVHSKLVDGTAGIVAFIGYNGQEHGVVPKDVAVDVRAIKPEWLRHLIGITDLEPPLVMPPKPEKAESDGDTTADDGIGSDDGEGGDSGSDGAVEAGGNADDGAVSPAPTEPEPG
jgi:uncharacterized protein YaiL (DUF2058 family)